MPKICHELVTEVGLLVTEFVLFLTAGMICQIDLMRLIFVVVDDDVYVCDVYHTCRYVQRKEGFLVSGWLHLVDLAFLDLEEDLYHR